MSDQAAGKADGLQATEIVCVVEHTLSSGRKAAVRVPVLRMRHDDAVGEKIDCRGHGRPLLIKRCRFKEIGGVEHDFYTRAPHLVDQPAGLLRRVDDIGKLRLDAEIDVAAVCNADRRFHGLEQIAPGFRRVVFGVLPPLVEWIARAGAKRDEAGGHRVAAFRQNG